MKTKACCLILVLLVTSLAAAQKLSPGPTPLCSPPPKVPYTNWVQNGFDPCLTWYNPWEFILNPSNVGNLGLAWNYYIGGMSSLRASTLCTGPQSAVSGTSARYE